MQEIERKYLIRKLPDLADLQSIKCERHFLKIEQGTEERIQKKGEVFEYEKKHTLSELQAKKEKRVITKDEFKKLKESAIKSVSRSSYLFSSDPEISIKVYDGAYLGLIRAEVEFTSEDEAKAFVPPAWFGKEITGTPLARDSQLVQLSQQDFKDLLES